MTVKLKDAEHEKKTADRPFRRGTPIQFYADDEFIAAVDEWSKRQPGRPLTRSEALRRLGARGLKAETEEAAALEAEAAKKGKKR